jgi:5'-nucleotidase
MEGLIEDIPSIAFSLASFSAHNFQPAANFAQTLVEQLARSPLPHTTLLSVNIPPVEETEIAGVCLTRQGLRRYIETFEERFDPRGKRYYWLAGEVAKEIEQPEHLHLSTDIPTDVHAIQDNYITITPLHYNLTDVAGFQSLSGAPWFPTHYIKKEPSSYN